MKGEDKVDLRTLHGQRVEAIKEYIEEIETKKQEEDKVEHLARILKSEKKGTNIRRIADNIFWIAAIIIIIMAWTHGTFIAEKIIMVEHCEGKIQTIDGEPIKNIEEQTWQKIKPQNKTKKEPQIIT